MPLYRCSQCGCVENTATGRFWGQTWAIRKGDSDGCKCSECLTGTWHGRFPKTSADGMVEDEGGFIWMEDEIKNGISPLHNRVARKIEPQHD